MRRFESCRGHERICETAGRVEDPACTGLNPEDSNLCTRDSVRLSVAARSSVCDANRRLSQIWEEASEAQVPPLLTDPHEQVSDCACLLLPQMPTLFTANRFDLERETHVFRTRPRSAITSPAIQPANHSPCGTQSMCKRPQEWHDRGDNRSRVLVEDEVTCATEVLVLGRRDLVCQQAAELLGKWIVLGVDHQCRTGDI